MGLKQLHALSSNMFNSFNWQVDIVLTKNDIHTLVDIVIINPTRADLLLQSCATQGFDTFDVVQTNDRSYHN
jgi:hypothetical protein